MTEININQDVFNWFLDKAKSLQPPKMSIKVGPYIFTLRRVYVKVKLGNQVAKKDVEFERIDPNATSCELANIFALEFYVKVLYGCYDIIVEFHRDGNVYTMRIDSGAKQEDVDKIINAVNNVTSKNSEVNRKNYLIIELNDVINYLNEGYNKAHEEDEDEYTVYTDEMSKKAIKPLIEILSYLVGDEE